MMHRNRSPRTTVLYWLGALTVVAGGAFASSQEPVDPPRPRPNLTPPPLRPESAPGEDLQQEMLALFKSVEKRLREIDALLVDAGAGDTRRLQEAGPAGIDQLIQGSIQNGRRNLEDIDRIIEIARELGQQSSSSSSSSSSSQPQDGQEGQSGSPTQRSGQSTSRENTPEGPQPGGEEPQPSEEPGGEEPGGEQPAGEEPGGEQPGGEEPRPEGQGDPQDGGPADAQDARNRPGDEPPGGATGSPGSRGEDADRWGDLPVKVRDVFRHEGSEELPPQYRDWIDAYYRRLQRQGGGR